MRLKRLKPRLFIGGIHPKNGFGLGIQSEWHSNTSITFLLLFIYIEIKWKTKKTSTTPLKTN